MIKTSDILKAHSTTDERLAAMESKARTPRSRTFWLDRRNMNDHAYFLLVFGRFEQHVDVQCGKLITKRMTATSWKRKRLWESVDLERIAFMQKVALLCKKGDSDYNKIHDFYKDYRCPIAHGENVGPIIVPQLSMDLREISSRLKGV